MVGWIEYKDIREIKIEEYVALLKKNRESEEVEGLTTNEWFEYHKWRFHSFIIDETWNEKKCSVMWNKYIQDIMIYEFWHSNE
jgi:hypothetical protein